MTKEAKSSAKVKKNPIDLVNLNTRLKTLRNQDVNKKQSPVSNNGYANRIITADKLNKKAPSRRIESCGFTNLNI
ncbi:MAG: hypothetical protein COB81_05595 [Flavobacteriaceae bacterium]|nr:MAG: hypothetical protein COB81_05595 [Flavobacteriaceae bacterium]